MRKKSGAVTKINKLTFDPKIFLDKVGEGVTVFDYREMKLFSHKERLRTQSFTSSKARSSSLSFPSKAKKR